MKVEKLLELKRKMEIIIADYISRVGGEYANANKDINIICPPADIYEDNLRQIVFLESPDIISSSVQCSIKDNMIVFRAEKEGRLEKFRKYLHMERSIGSYFKVIPLLHEESRVEKTEYDYKYGVIKITVFYREE